MSPPGVDKSKTRARSLWIASRHFLRQRLLDGSCGADLETPVRRPEVHKSPAHVSWWADQRLQLLPGDNGISDQRIADSWIKTDRNGNMKYGHDVWASPLGCTEFALAQNQPLGAPACATAMVCQGAESHAERWREFTSDLELLHVFAVLVKGFKEGTNDQVVVEWNSVLPNMAELKLQKV